MLISIALVHNLYYYRWDVNNVLAHSETSVNLDVYIPYTPYSGRMSQENTHKLMGFYMEVLL